MGFEWHSVLASLAHACAAVAQAAPAESGLRDLLEDLIKSYGYYALFVGTCLEGETIMILAGIAARGGHLSLPWVVLLGFLGSLTGDQTIFFLSRWKGRALLAKHPAWHPRIEKISRLLDRHGTWFTLTFRFYYGLRNISPLVIGVSSIPTARFVLLNVTGAALWAITLGCLGYAFGLVIQNVVDNLKWVILAVACLGALVWLIRHIYLWCRAKRMKVEEASRAEAEPPGSSGTS